MKETTGKWRTVRKFIGTLMNRGIRLYENGWVEIEGVRFKAIRYTDTGIVHAFKSRRPTRVSRQIAKTFTKEG